MGVRVWISGEHGNLTPHRRRWRRPGIQDHYDPFFRESINCSGLVIKSWATSTATMPPFGVSGFSVDGSGMRAYRAASLVGFLKMEAVNWSEVVIFRVMGRPYETAVICSGFGGISSLGPTPSGMANVQHGRPAQNQLPGPSGLLPRAVGIGVHPGYQQCHGDPARPQLAELSGGNC